MLSEEDEVTLVVERNDTSSVELRVVRKQRREHPRKRASEARVEVVQDHFRHVRRHVPTVLYSRQKYINIIKPCSRLSTVHG